MRFRYPLVDAFELTLPRVMLAQELEERDRRLQELTQENDTLRSRPPAPPEETSSPNAQPSPQFRARIQKAEALVSELRGELSALVSETERPGDASNDSHELRAELERERTERERLQSDMTALQSRHEQAVEDLENLRGKLPDSLAGDLCDLTARVLQLLPRCSPLRKVRPATSRPA